MASKTPRSEMEAFDAFYPDIEAFDAILAGTEPHKRAGFLDSFYSKNRESNDLNYLLALASLLEKWSKDPAKADFSLHIKKLRRIANVPKGITSPEEREKVVAERRRTDNVFTSVDTSYLSAEESVQKIKDLVEAQASVHIYTHIDSSSGMVSINNGTRQVNYKPEKREFFAATTKNGTTSTFHDIEQVVDYLSNKNLIPSSGLAIIELVEKETGKRPKFGCFSKDYAPQIYLNGRTVTLKPGGLLSLRSGENIHEGTSMDTAQVADFLMEKEVLPPSAKEIIELTEAKTGSIPYFNFKEGGIVGIELCGREITFTPGEKLFHFFSPEGSPAGGTFTDLNQVTDYLSGKDSFDQSTKEIIRSVEEKSGETPQYLLVETSERNGDVVSINLRPNCISLYPGNTKYFARIDRSPIFDRGVYLKTQNEIINFLCLHPAARNLIQSIKEKTGWEPSYRIFANGLIVFTGMDNKMATLNPSDDRIHIYDGRNTGEELNGLEDAIEYLTSEL